MDFESGVDRISIVTLAPITADRFIFGSDPVAPVSGGAFILYDTDNGHLRVDPNGPAVGASELMAVLVGAPTLVFADLVFGL